RRVRQVRWVWTNSGEPRARRNRMYRSVRVAVLEPADDRQPFLERRERLENAAELTERTNRLGRPLAHDRAKGEVHECETRHRSGGGGGQRRARGNHRVQERQRDGGAHAAQKGPPIEVHLRDEHLPPSDQSPPVPAPSVGSPPPEAKRTSCVVMHSSSPGLPSFVARMPLPIACPTCSGSVTRSPYPPSALA